MKLFPDKISAFLFLIQISLFAQTDKPSNNQNFQSKHWLENGIPYIQNFSPKDYNAEIQNFEIIQDKQGYIYSGNNLGVLSYDGISWRLIQTPSRTVARSLYINKDTIYVGSVGDFGYLSPDSNGELVFISLLEFVPEQYRNFQDVYEIINHNNILYFRTRNSILKWQDGKIKVLEVPKQLGDLFVFSNNLFIVSNEEGLLQLRNDFFQSIPGSDIFIDLYVRTMIPFDETRFLICTFEEGLFLSDGKNFEKFTTKIDNFLSQHKIYGAVKLEDNLFAFGTSRGAVIIDKEGNLCQIIDKTSGLRDDFVINIFADREGGLWLALNNGIARVETPSSVSRFQDNNGLESFIEDIIRFKGKIYAASDRGVFYLDNTTFPFPRFKQVSGFSSLTFSLEEVSGRLLTGTQGGVYEIFDTEAVKINDLPARFLYTSKVKPNIVYAGLIEGLAAIKLVNNKWVTINRVPGFIDRILSIKEDDQGVLWIGTPYEGVVKAKVKTILSDNQPQLEADIVRFTEKNGLPPGQKKPILIDKKMLIATIKGLKYFDTKKNLFLPDTSFGAFFADSSTEINFINEDKNNNVWIIAKRNKKVAAGKAVLQSNGSYIWYEKPFYRINDLGNTYLVYPEEDGTTWFGGSEGIARYSPYYQKDYSLNYPAVIRRIKDISSDTISFNGTIHPGFSTPELEHNSLRFEFSALYYNDVLNNMFQYILEGYEINWSEWSSETWKEYTALPAGNYKFKVRAKNIYNHLSSEDTFSFTIIPQWYQRWWAYIIYSIFAAAIIFLAVKVRVRRLESRTHQLENIIFERTHTIRDQADKLKELDHLKSRFFANISHEFRTPLTLILGILDKYLKNSKENGNDFKVMQKNAKRLLQLINQLLELSKLESESIKIAAQKTELVKFIRRITSSFISLAEQKRLFLSFNDYSESKEIWVYIDRDKIETIIYNLLSNAIKFTPEEGKISVNIKPSSNLVKIKIINTGITIPEEHLEKIFDRFYQIEDKISGSYEGTGIGLALVKELIELHHGKIKVESYNSQTTFTVTILSGKEHFSSNDILEREEIKPVESIDKSEQEETIEKSEEINIYPEAESDIVLVVEDNIDLRHFIRDQLRDDYKIAEAEDGEKGLKLAEEIIPDLIISDIMMPKINGYELCNRVKKNLKTNHIPVILLTAKASLENKLEGLEIGADDYLIKPFNTDELKTRVKNLITIRQKMREKFLSEMIIKPAGVVVPSDQKVFIEKLTAIIETHIEDENFSVEGLSLEMGMSRVQLHRKIKALSNQSTSEFIRSFRLQRAAELIKQNAGNFTEIAYRVGFNSQAYFNISFQKMFGITPGEFKKKNS